VFQVVITARAKADLQQAANWWKENRSATEAETWYIGISAKIETLTHMPTRCRLATESKQVKREIHQLLYGVSSRPTHRILFGIDGDTVTIYRVLHTSQAIIQDDSSIE
jgi:plasmid stabilization system protein ParE